jgi:hypothetical protein
MRGREEEAGHARVADVRCGCHDLPVDDLAADAVVGEGEEVLR